MGDSTKPEQGCFGFFGATHFPTVVFKFRKHTHIAYYVMTTLESKLAPV